MQVGFIGAAIQQIEPFVQLLEALGEVGLLGHRGRFSIDKIANAHPAAAETTLWQGGTRTLAPHISDFSALVEEPVPQSLRLEFMTPARLLSQGRPLFKPDFAALFPFILRRVGAMLATWTDSRQLFDVPLLLAHSTRVVSSDNDLKWLDWRPLGGYDEAGGVCGSITLAGPELSELWPILKLGELLGLGRGAAYGAGRYRLS